MRRCRRFACILVALVGCSGELIPAATEETDSPSGPDAGAQMSMAFRPGIQEDMDTFGCTNASCHGGTVAPMPLTPAPSSDSDWMANYEQVSARVGGATSSLLIDKATGAGGHIATLTDGDAIVTRWRSWIASGAPYEPSSGGPDTGPDAGPSSAPDAGNTDEALTWTDDIEPLLRANDCMDCHGTAGAYSLESYSAALGFGTDGIANVIPGDPTSLLIIYCEQGHFDIPYDDTLQVISWIVDWSARER